MDEMRQAGKPVRKVLVLGSGSGIDAVTIAREHPDVIVHAVDIDPFSVASTKAFVAKEGLSERIKVWQSDAFSKVTEKYDLVVLDAPAPAASTAQKDAARFDPRGQFILAVLDGLQERLEKNAPMFVMAIKNLWVELEAMKRGMRVQNVEEKHRIIPLLRIEATGDAEEQRRLRNVWRDSVGLALERVDGPDFMGQRLSERVSLTRDSKVLDLAPGNGDISLSLAAWTGAHVEAKWPEDVPVSASFRTDLAHLESEGFVLQRQVVAGHSYGQEDLSDYDAVHVESDFGSPQSLEQLVALRDRLKAGGYVVATHKGEGPMEWLELADRVWVADTPRAEKTRRGLLVEPKSDELIEGAA